jgi:hypothetical protein
MFRFVVRAGNVMQRRLWKTGAGRLSTSYTATAHVEDWRRSAAAPVVDLGRRTSREPTAGVIDRLRNGQSSDSETGVYALLDWDNVPDCITRLLRLE